MTGSKIDCNGNCLNCPYPEMPEECEKAPLTYEDYIELRRIEKEFVHPKTPAQKKRAIYDRRYYEKHREKCNARRKKWREDNLDHVRAVNRRYYKEHKEECLARGKYFYRKNRASRLAKKKEWREANPTYFHDYYQKNKGRINERCDQNRRKYGPIQASIKMARTARGWTQKDLAKHMGLSYKTIACWERGINPANWEKLYQVMPELQETANG